jgi:hypothetical protein
MRQTMRLQRLAQAATYRDNNNCIRGDSVLGELAGAHNIWILRQIFLTKLDFITVSALAEFLLLDD